MSEHCSSCSEGCDKESCEGCESRKGSMIEKTHAGNSIKKIIGVLSGKGGVGKSLVTSLLAVSMNRQGKNTAILDADITGPSIPQIFGVHERAKGNGEALIPAESKTGVKLMSVNLLLDHESDPVIWRGPVIAGMVKQFWTDVLWGNVDYMFVDMPPGTGDVPLTVFQSIPLDGIIIVTSPQELVSMIVTKAVNMAEMMNIPVLGLVQNMSYALCPDCGKEIKIFGDSHIEDIAKAHNITNIAKLPIDPRLAACCDKGMIELFDGTWLDDMCKEIM